MLIEPVTGTNGIIVPPDNYLPALQETLSRHGILLIADEVMSGFGRTGAWFAYQRWGIQPDMVTMAKGLTSSYVPLGAVAVSAPIAHHFDEHMLWAGLTYSGHPVSCAAGVAAIEVYEREGLIDRSRALGEVLRDRLLDMQERHPCIGDVRAVGLFSALELVKDRGSKEPLSPLYGPQTEPMRRIAKALRERGVDVFTRFNLIIIAPPLVISEEDLLWGLEQIDEVLAEV
jgi:taurine--2-oxoglutarate transaminase